ncbi:dihydroneopterin aldolase, partial [Cytobacillus oceanisediminis]|uniref:dihydroneopterin aldolase n=1 Tax=Cytobacillus oceanisediminis TaxID=665099 RepID=UPI0037BEE37E
MHLNQIHFYPYHPLFPQQTSLPQTFPLHFTLHLHLSTPPKTHQLHHSINYPHLYQLSRDILQPKPYNLVQPIPHKI